MNKRRGVTGLLFALPAAVVYLPLLAIPLVYTFALSLHRWDGLAPSWRWYGLGNYSSLLNDRIFWIALWHNLLLIGVSLVVQLPLGLALALLLRRAGRLTGLIRTSIFIPYILPTVVIALVWRLLFTRAVPTLYGDAQWMLPLVIVAISWRFIGFHMVLYLAGLATIDPQLEEAATLDGAGHWAIFRHITLPLLKPVLVVSATLAVIGSIKYFDIVYVMAGGDPPQSTELLATYMFEQGFDARRFGYASAIAVAMVAAAGLGAGIIWLATRVRVGRRS